MSDPNKPQTVLAGAPAKDDMPRKSLASRLKSFVLIFLLVVLPFALFYAFTQYMYVCRIQLPAGKTTVDHTGVPGRRSRLGELIYGVGICVPDGSALPCWIRDHLGYRYYIVPRGAEAIEGHLFLNNRYLRGIRLPDGLKRIGSGVFQGCENLREIVIPDSVTEIGFAAFLGCRSLPLVVIGKNVVRIGGGAFSGTGCKLVVPDDHPYFKFEDGILYSKDGKELLSCVTVPDGGRVVVPPGVKIAPYAFASCPGLTEVLLPAGVKEITPYAFASCPGLTEVLLPVGVKTIREGAFSRCTGLKHVEMPDSVTEIGNSAFEECEQLEEIDIPDGIEIIYPYTFQDCKNLKRVALPSGLKNILEEAFSGCSSLANMELPDSLVKIASDAFEGCPAVDVSTIPAGKLFNSVEEF